MRSSTLTLLCAAALLIVVSCRREAEAPPASTASTPTATSATQTAPPQDLRNAAVNTVIAPEVGVYVDNARLGSAVGTDGMVTEEKTEFARGEDVRLSMWFRQSPAGLQASARLEDEAGKEIDTEQKAMNGQKNVTFTVGDRKLKPGKYKITGYWGGNVAAEYEFAVTGAAASSKAKSKAKR